jgi:hypothetical protein
MNARNFGLSLSGQTSNSFRKTRTFIAKILMRFSCAYADLALWVAQWIKKEGSNQ